MNETVLKLVNMLFSETEMTREAQSLRDELLANCRERYDDAIAEGKTVDEAIGRVVESLKGMEEVIDAYPKKRELQMDDDDEDDDEQTSQSEYRFAMESVHAIELDVRNTNIVLERIDGAQVCVTVSDDAIDAVTVAQNGDAICVASADASRRHGSFDWLIDLVTVFSGSGNVTIGVPEGHAVRLTARSTSGDIMLSNVTLTAADISSTSGEVRLSPAPNVRLSSAKVNTASGDIYIELAADALQAKSMSGEVRISGEAKDINASSISGDLKLKCGAQKAVLKTISGDIRWKCPTTDIKDADLNTTSGDIRLRLPADIETVRLAASTMSGSIKNAFTDIGVESAVKVRASSVSGDISVLRRQD